MSNDLPPNSTVTDLAEFKTLFGSPPVLSTESSKAYDAIMDRFMGCINPRDFVEQMLVKDLTDWTWDILRCTRHKTWTIERKYRQHVEFQERRKILRAERRKALAEKAEQTGKPATQLERIYELEDVIDDSGPDVDEILNRKPEELDHARAFEGSIDYFERLDRLISTAMARRNDTLEQLNIYREGLGHHLGRISDKIIEGEFSESTQEEISLVPVIE